MSKTELRPSVHVGGASVVDVDRDRVYMSPSILTLHEVELKDLFCYFNSIARSCWCHFRRFDIMSRWWSCRHDIASTKLKHAGSEDIAGCRESIRTSAFRSIQPPVPTALSISLPLRHVYRTMIRCLSSKDQRIIISDYHRLFDITPQMLLCSNDFVKSTFWETPFPPSFLVLFSETQQRTTTRPSIRLHSLWWETVFIRTAALGRFRVSCRFMNLSS